MNILAINSSHRPGKNTALMLNLVLNEIKDKGGHTELLELANHKIELCRACNKCLQTPECSVLNDDMAMIAEKMLKADAIVLGSPVYFANVTSLMKIFIDRTRWMHMCKNLLDGKVGGVLTHAGLRNGGQEMTQMILERFLQHHGVHVVDSRIVDAPIYNIGVIGTLFDDMKDEKILWKKGVMDDPLTIMMCRALGQNILRQLNR
ncbi:flavodoxin family protein [Desulfocicer niacini]